MIRATNGTQQDRDALRRLADQAQAEAVSGVVSPSTQQDFLEGVEAALRWAAGDGNTDDLSALIARANVAEAAAEQNLARVSVTDDLISFEAGELDEDDTLDLFQRLVDSGLAWQLQGHYGRTAATLIQSGAITLTQEA